MNEDTPQNESTAPYVLCVGDIITDAFVKLSEDHAKVITDDKGYKRLSFELGAKLPYDEADIVEAVEEICEWDEDLCLVVADARARVDDDGFLQWLERTRHCVDRGDCGLDLRDRRRLGPLLWLDLRRRTVGLRRVEKVLPCLAIVHNVEEDCLCNTGCFGHWTSLMSS